MQWICQNQSHFHLTFCKNSFAFSTQFFIIFYLLFTCHTGCVRKYQFSIFKGKSSATHHWNWDYKKHARKNAEDSCITHAGAHHVVFSIKIVSDVVVTGIVWRNEQRQTVCCVLQMGLSECLPLNACSEKFTCHVLELPGCQWFFKCTQHFLSHSHLVWCCWCGCTRNVTYVRRGNVHPVHGQHVSQGKDWPKQRAKAKKMPHSFYC